MQVKLRASGILDKVFSERLNGLVPANAPVEEHFYDVPALIVYEGQFETATVDEETNEHVKVSVNAKKIEALAASHNAHYLKVTAGGTLPQKAADCPPVQADHEYSVWDTVGRLVGPVMVGDYIPSHGSQGVKALFGTLRFLGQDNCQRAKDGRFAKLSMGGDLEEGRLSEVSVVVFPAAPDASMLANGGDVKMAGVYEKESVVFLPSPLAETTPNRPRIVVYKGNNGRWGYSVYAEGEYMPKASKNGLASKEDAIREGKAASKLSSGSEPKEKLMYEGFEAGMLLQMIRTVGELKKGDEVIVVTIGAPGHVIVRKGYDGKPVAVPQKAVVKLAGSEPNDLLSSGTGDKLTFKKKKSEPGPSYKGFELTVTTWETPMGDFYSCAADGTYESGISDRHVEGDQFDSKSEAIADTKRKVDRVATKLSKGDDMNMAKLKKNLMLRDKLSEKDAETKLAGMSEDEQKKLEAYCPPGEKKMAEGEDPAKEKLEDGDKDKDKEKLADDPEKEKKDKLAGDEEDKDKKKDEKDAKMSAARPGIVKLAKAIRKGLSSSKLEHRKGHIAQRLAGLRAKALITPAEVKKIDVDALAGKSEEALTAFFSAFESREPVVMTGQFGTVKATNIAEIEKEVAEHTQLQTSISNMPFTGKAVGDKLTGKKKGKGTELGEGGKTTEVKLSSGLESGFADVVKLLDEGKRESALSGLKQLIGRHTEGVQLSGDSGAEKRFQALAESHKTLENQFEDLLEMVTPLFGIESEELSA